MNLTNTIAARMAFFLAGSWALAAGETAKPERVVYVLNTADRELLAWEALAVFAEQHDGYVSKNDIVAAAWLWSTSDDEVRLFATDFAHALTGE